MSLGVTDRIRAHCRPLESIATDTAPSLQKLPDIRAVLFDVYGTLIISASGDIGLDSGSHRAQALAEVASQFGVTLECSSEQGIALLEQTIREEHARAKSRGVDYPEIEIRETWEHVLSQIAGASQLDLDCGLWSLEFELRVNPTWTMPGARELLDDLQRQGLVIGIVSNAQFFTPMLFPALLDKSLEDWGVTPELSFFSFEHRRAKPGTYLYELAAKGLLQQKISPEQVLYIGNDMLNDVTPAHEVGFRTALFAGDQRSLRWRSEDPRVHGVKADIVVTHLPQLMECLPHTL